MKGLVSVVIPHYNRGYIIEKTVQSVLEQTYQNFEIIIVDDGSKEESLAVLRRLNTHDKITVYELQTNHGANYCRHYGVQQANGEYIAFLDSDDLFLPTKLTQQIELLTKHPEYAFVVTNFGQKKRIGFTEHGEITLKELLFENFIGGFSTLMVRRDLFLTHANIDTNLPSCQDWDVYLNLLTHTKGYKLREHLVDYQIQTDSLSKNAHHVFNGLATVQDKANKLNDQYHLVNATKLASYHHYYLALRHLKFGNIAQFKSLIKQSWQEHITLKNTIYYTLSLFKR